MHSISGCILIYLRSANSSAMNSCLYVVVGVIYFIFKCVGLHQPVTQRAIQDKLCEREIDP